MTIRLALDPVDGFRLNQAGLIAGISPTIAGLDAAGFGTYTGFGVRNIDETDTDVWSDDCEPGWYWFDGKVQPSKPLTNAERVAVDIANFKESVEREAVDWERVVAEENFQPHTDSGHAWSTDLLHALIKPNVRGLVVLLTTAEGDASDDNITAYRARLDSFIGIAENPGVLAIYHNADKAVWRPLRTGDRAYGYDPTTHGTRTGASFAVAYPDGESVATWDALGAVRGL